MGNYSVSQTFLVLGILSVLIIIIGALFVGVPADYEKVVIYTTEEPVFEDIVFKNSNEEEISSINEMFYIKSGQVVIDGNVIPSLADNIERWKKIF